MVSSLDVQEIPARAAWEDDLATVHKGRLRTFFDRRRRIILGSLGALLVLGAWQVCAVEGVVNQIYTSYPTQIALAFKTFFTVDNGWYALRVSMTEFGIGMGLSLVIGLLAGLAIGWWSWLEALCEPVINFCYAVPRIALVPLLVIWFGIGLWSKVAVVFITAMFPILINTISGVKTVDASFVQVGRAFNASRLQLFRTVLLPGALPSIVTGIRLGIGIGLIGMVVGELIASTAGLGYTIERAGNLIEAPLMFVAVILVALAGVLLTQALRVVEKRLDKWRPQIGA